MTFMYLFDFEILIVDFLCAFLHFHFSFGNKKISQSSGQKMSRFLLDEFGQIKYLLRQILDFPILYLAQRTNTVDSRRLVREKNVNFIIQETLNFLFVRFVKISASFGSR
jgi:hypothetical protein